MIIFTVDDGSIMKQMMFFMLSILILTACARTSGSSKPNSNDHLVSVPAEYAGKMDPYGADVASEGDKLFQTNC